MMRDLLSPRRKYHGVSVLLRRVLSIWGHLVGNHRSYLRSLGNVERQMIIRFDQGERSDMKDAKSKRN